MRLVRVGEPGRERPAVMIPGSEDKAFDLTGLVRDFDAEFFSTDGPARVAAAIDSGGLPYIGVDDVRVGAPIARPQAIYGIGLNYRDHAREVGMAAPLEPIIFNKAPNTLVGPHDDIILPPGSTYTDWEVELGVVVGRRASYLESPEAAAAHIAGFVAVNDVSERDMQLHRGGQWVKGKSFETFNPAGPFLVTADELSDLSNLRLVLRVNGEIMQDGTTADLVFDPSYLVWYLSQFMVLEPGDLIDTGTPAGVGMSFDPPRYLQPGDVLELEITGLGGHRNLVRSANTSAVDRIAPSHTAAG
jgi:2,4-diketo-3-deoxy-L-fuconate hydrolase